MCSNAHSFICLFEPDQNFPRPSKISFWLMSQYFVQNEMIFESVMSCTLFVHKYRIQRFVFDVFIVLIKDYYLDNESIIWLLNREVRKCRLCKGFGYVQQLSYCLLFFEVVFLGEKRVFNNINYLMNCIYTS